MIDCECLLKVSLLNGEMKVVSRITQNEQNEQNERNGRDKNGRPINFSALFENLIFSYRQTNSQLNPEIGTYQMTRSGPIK